jgi:CRISPR-associated protein Csd1
MRAIITDSRYPESLFANLLIRIRAEQGDITWKKASMIKAYLIKNKGLKEEEKYVSLNVDSENKAYQIGRLFAFMELAQRSASSAPLNVTIRDRYIVSAAVTPAVIFPGILKTYNAHLKKIRGDKPGLAVRIDKDVQSVMGKIDEFPKTISNEDQMAFYLGYYHQTQECYKPKNKTDKKEMNGGEENASN